MGLRYSPKLAVAFLAFFSARAAGYLVDPPTTADPNTVQDCSNWAVVTSTDTCQALATQYFITLQDFNSYNPSVGASCSLIVGNSYCVERNWGIPVSTSTTSTTSTTSVGNGVSTPTPTQTGMTTSCNKFHKVVSGDTCGDLASANGISLANFYAWNPAVGSTCSTLLLDYYVCVGILGTSTTTTTTPTNGISTPTPTQTGMVTNCNKFHKVVSGDTCGDLATANGITLANFYAWNPAVGSTCSTLILDYYVCVGIIGTATSTTTSPTNGVVTPTPTQTGMVANCNKFHKVVSGDTCGDLATANGITLANFYAWNPAVGSTCSLLLLDYYVCVGIIGTTTSTTTTPTNGVSTPTPTQTGMVTNCNKFHKVVSGDTCSALATANGITLANFYAWNPAVGSSCSLLLLDYYVCVGIIGSTTTSTPTTTTGNGVATPTPTQPNMTKNCSKFYKVKSGDQCGTIASANGITLTQFYAWNPDVGSTCATLFLDYYVCVGVLSGARRRLYSSG